MKNILLSAGEAVGKVTEWITKVDESGNIIDREILTSSMELSDRIAYALQRTLIGIIIVFGVLAIIWLVLSLFKVVFYKDPNKKKAEKKEEPASAPVTTVLSAPVAPVQDDGAVIAAIVAAISAMRAEQGIVDGFRVVSFKRGTNKPWNIK